MNLQMLLSALAVLVCGAAAADELVLPKSLERDQRADFGNRHLENAESTSFIVPPAGDPWSDYQIIMWQGQTLAGYATLKKLGITAGMVQPDHRDEASTAMPSLARLVDADLRCYLENIATDFYSPYHKWYDGRPVDWRFLEAKERYWANPHDRAAFIREPSLSDPEWLNKIHDRSLTKPRPRRRCSSSGITAC